jgi:hypothetical protein
MVELAIGLLLWITILAFGIHFAEVSYIAVRVEEAAAYAVYDTTGQRTHEKGNKRFNLSATIPGLSSSETKKKWGDFEANSGGDWAQAKMSHVFTEYDKLYQGITCTKAPSLKYSTDAPVIGLGVPNPFSAGNDTGGVKCTASATVSLVPGFPKDFRIMGGQREKQWAAKGAAASGSYKICATPRSVHGNCGSFGILVGDFSLQGPAESTSNDLFSGGNTAYYDVVNDAMGLTGCPLAMAASTAVATAVSFDACTFAFSYKGVEKNYTQNVGSEDDTPGGRPAWNTGGTNTRRTVRKPETFLGVVR